MKLSPEAQRLKDERAAILAERLKDPHERACYERRQMLAAMTPEQLAAYEAEREAQRVAKQAAAEEARREFQSKVQKRRQRR